MKIYFATWLADVHNGILLTKMKSPNRLLSYYWICNHNANSDDVRAYIKDGIRYLYKNKNKIRKDD